MEKFAVFIEENNHYADETARREFGVFFDYDQAVKACQSIVDEYLTKNYKKGMPAEELYQHYTMFGEDAFIVGDAPNGKFSAWNYAEKRCREICRNQQVKAE